MRLPAGGRDRRHAHPRVARVHHEQADLTVVGGRGNHDGVGDLCGGDEVLGAVEYASRPRRGAPWSTGCGDVGPSGLGQPRGEDAVTRDDVAEVARICSASPWRAMVSAPSTRVA